MKILTGARTSPLSRAQLKEVQEEIVRYYPFVSLEPVWVETIGDRDKKTSLRDLGKSDFFTRDIDTLLLSGAIRIAIHSAKDLPDPMPEGLTIAAITKGKDPRDALVLKEGYSGDTPLVATSSERREESVRHIYPKALFRDLRGTIHERLALIDRGEVDGIVVAEAALIRLGLTHLPRLFLPGETAPLQGQLAIVIREEDNEARLLFKILNSQTISPPANRVRLSSQREKV